MSNEFVVVLAGPPKSLRQAWYPVHSALKTAGFAAASSVFRLEIDEAGAGFEMVDDDDLEEICEIDSIHDQKALSIALSRWGGLFVQYAREDFSLGLGLGLAASHTNYFLRFSTRVLRELFELDDVIRLYRVIVSIAEASGATAGFGERELDFLRVDMGQAINGIWSNPDNQDYPSSLGILSVSAQPESELNKCASQKFSLRRIGEAYYVLEENDYLDIYSSL